MDGFMTIIHVLPGVKKLWESVHSTATFLRRAILAFKSYANSSIYNMLIGKKSYLLDKNFDQY